MSPRRNSQWLREEEESVVPTMVGSLRGAASPALISAPRRVPAAFDPLIGQTIADRYALETVIGEGGMGRVYRARHVATGRRFAVKVLHAELAAHPKMRLRFEREAEATSRVAHRNVIGVVDAGEIEPGRPYLVTDLVDGTPLRTLIRGEAPLAGDRALALLGDLASGLAHAHDRGLVHRDFKPDNILVENNHDGELARIVDFGIAVVPESVVGPRLTTDGLVLGTPHYMAPEQITGQDLDHRADLYALGVVLYEMLSGVTPFDGPPALLAQMHLHDRVPAIAERVPGLDVDPLLETLALRLLAKRPAERPASAHEVVDLVELLRTDRDAAAAALAIPTEPIADVPTQRARLTAPAAPAGWRLALTSAAMVVLGVGALQLMAWRREVPSPVAAVTAPSTVTAPELDTLVARWVASFRDAR